MRFLRLLLALILSAGYGAAQGRKTTGAVESGQPQFSLKVGREAGSIVSGDPTIQIVWTNTSNRDIWFQRAPVAVLFSIDVRDPAGRRPAAAKGRGSEDGELPMMSGPLLRLPPGESLTFHVNLSTEFRLEDVGGFTVQAHRTDARTKSVVHSNVIVLSKER
jgi:hypothetical protein